MDKKVIFEKLLTNKEAAEYLGISKDTLTIWRHQKRYEIPYVKIGHLVRYKLSALNKWIEMRTVK